MNCFCFGFAHTLNFGVEKDFSSQFPSRGNVAQKTTWPRDIHFHVIDNVRYQKHNRVGLLTVNVVDFVQLEA